MEASAISRTIILVCVHMRLLNSCNMVIVYLYRQGDLRHFVIRWFKDQFRGRKSHTDRESVGCLFNNFSNLYIEVYFPLFTQSVHFNFEFLADLTIKMF
ncbi:unnamed protein product [Onchocerca flexuosa]|uniref:Secreted protein n=1 Tax=Onchocerca flexuosa TaxID=387005 RepID=A0A183HXK1_9BILA|nr:unnamed protein product [Onchocerca flexuosa]